MEVIQWGLIGLFLVVAVLGLVSQCLLLKWTDWSTTPDTTYRLVYFAFGFWSASLLTKHIVRRRLQTVLLLRKAWIAMFSSALALVVLNLALLATWRW